MVIIDQSSKKKNLSIFFCILWIIILYVWLSILKVEYDLTNQQKCQNYLVDFEEISKKHTTKIDENTANIEKLETAIEKMRKGNFFIKLMI